MRQEEPGKGREAVDPEEVLFYWFPEDDMFEADRETFGLQIYPYLLARNMGTTADLSPTLQRHSSPRR